MGASESGLFPGYRHVDAFGPDEEYESGEEVEYVTLDLGTIEPTLVPSSSSFRIIGLDTPTPYLQLSGTKLKGQHQSLLGTELLFTEASDESQQHSAHGKKPLMPVATTERRIRFKEIELKPKGDGAATDVPSASTSKSTTAKKVKTQMDHVMGNHSDTPRRGRGGKKRGGTTKAQTPTQSRIASSTDMKESVDEPTDQSTESQPAPANDAIDPALIQMDTSEG